MPSGRSVKAGNAFIQFSLRDGAVKKQLRALQKRMVAVGAGLQKLGSIGLKVGVATAAGLALPIKAASDLQETMGKFNTVFGANSTAVKKWGDNFAGEVGRSKTQVAGFLSSMQDLFVPLGFASDDAEGLSKRVTRLAIDLASFNNMNDTDTIRDLQAALTGSGEVMKKYGVIVSQAAVNQELLNQGLDPKKASEQEKVQARLNIIMAGTTAAQGDAIRTSGSFANMWKRMKASATDFAAAIGGPLLNPLSNLMGMISSVLSNSAGSVQQFFTKVIAIDTKILGFLKSAFMGVYEFVAPIITSVADFVISAVTKIYEYTQPIVSSLLVVVQDAFIAIWNVAKTVWTGVVDVISWVWGKIGGVVTTALNWMQKAITGTLSVVSFAFNNFGLLVDTAVTSALLSVVKFSNQVVHLFTEVIPGYLRWFMDNWRDIFTDWLNFNKTIYSNLWTNIKSLWDGITGLFSGEGFSFEWTPLTQGFESAIKEMPKIAAREMGPLEKALQDQMNDLGDQLAKQWDNHGKTFAKRVEGFTPDGSTFDVADITSESQKKTAATVSSASNEVSQQARKTGGSSRGTFSAAAVTAGALQGGGTLEDLNKQQLAELKKANRMNKKTMRVTA